MPISRGQIANQISKPPMKGDKKMKKVIPTPKGLTYFRKGGAASKKSKGSKICPEGKAWAKLDTYPSAYANLALLNIAKILTMLKSLKA